MANVNNIRRSTLGGIPHSATGNPPHCSKEQGNPLTLAAIREVREGNTTGYVDTTSIESFIQTCSE